MNTGKTIDDTMSFPLKPLYYEARAELTKEGILSEEEVGNFENFQFKDLVGVYLIIEKQKIEDMESILQILTKEEIIFQSIGGREIRNTQRGIELSYELSSVYRLRAQKTLLTYCACKFYNAWHSLAKYRADSLWIDIRCQLLETLFCIKFDTEPLVILLESEKDMISKKPSEQGYRAKQLIEWLQWLQITYPEILNEHIIRAPILDSKFLIRAYEEYMGSLSL